MILRLYMEKEDRQGMRIAYQFVDAATQRIYATASDNTKEAILLHVDDSEYQFFNYPKFVEKLPINIKYPLSSKRKKTIGFHIKKEEECVAKFYGEAATCRKRGVFKRNIGFTVFEYAGEPYMLYRVGFPKQNSHYYCLYNNAGETVAIIERHSYYTDNCKATIYVEKEENTLIALFACTEKIISVGNSGNSDERIDPSAGPYISILDEEKAMYDEAFMKRVKMVINNGGVQFNVQGDCL